MQYEITWFDKAGNVLAIVHDDFDTLDSALFVISKALYQNAVTNLDTDIIDGITVKPVRQ